MTAVDPRDLDRFYDQWRLARDAVRDGLEERAAIHLRACELYLARARRTT